MAVFIIAEIGVNHDGSVPRARRLIREALRAGADAVKFQSFHVERLIVKGTRKASYQIRNTGGGESQDAMLARLALTPAAQRQLHDYATASGIEFLSSPFDEVSLRELARLGVRRLKIPSGEITNGPLLLAAARTRLPILLSTGMSSLGEVEEALAVIGFGLIRQASRPSRRTIQKALTSTAVWQALRAKVTLLHCTTQYPTPFADANLRAMQTLAGAFGLPVGYSDHTSGIAVALGAAALGATVIEKHFTLDRTLPGPDHKASLEPDEFAAMVHGVRAVEASLGGGRKACTPSELSNREIARKSLVAATAVRRGERLTAEMLTAKRPGNGRSPMDYWDLLNTRASRDLDADDRL